MKPSHFKTILFMLGLAGSAHLYAAETGVLVDVNPKTAKKKTVAPATGEIKPSDATASNEDSDAASAKKPAIKFVGPEPGAQMSKDEIKEQERLAATQQAYEEYANSHLAEAMNVRLSPDPNNPGAPIGFPAGTVVDYKGECGFVKVDCSEHKIYLSKTQSPELNPSDQVIDCGRAGLTHNGIGTVGGPRSGNVVKDGLQINIPGMGDSGGGKWFHTAWWRPGQLPNGTDSSKGCIHISPSMLKKLKTCDNAPLEILNATNGGMNPVQFSNDNDPLTPASSN